MGAPSLGTEPSRLLAGLPAALLFGALLAGALLAGGCAEAEKGIPHPSDRLHYPVTLTADPNGRYLYVVNSNFDVRYRTGSVIAIDLETNRLLPETAVGIGDFGGELALYEVSDPTPDRRLVGYVPARGDSELYWFAIAGGAGEDPLRTDCGEDAGAADAERIRECQDSHIIRTAERKRLPADDAGLEPQEIADANPDVPLSLGLDVYGATVFPGRDGVSDYLLVSNPRSGNVGVFHIDGDYPVSLDAPGQAAGDALEKSRPSEQGEPVFLDSVFVGSGVYNVALAPGDRWAYATTRFLNAVIPFQITEIPDPAGTDRRWPQVVELAAYPIVNTTTVGDYGRDLLFSADGTRAYLTYRNPSSVVLLDTAPDQEGVRANRFLDAVDVGRSPTAIAVAPTGPGGREWLYVVCFRAEELWVLDAATLEIQDIIPLPGGPFDLEIVDAPDRGRIRAYVAMFEQDAIAVVELDRTSPFFHQPVAYIRGVDDEGAHL